MGAHAKDLGIMNQGRAKFTNELGKMNKRPGEVKEKNQALEEGMEEKNRVLVEGTEAYAPELGKFNTELGEVNKELGKVNKELGEEKEKKQAMDEGMEDIGRAHV